MATDQSLGYTEGSGRNFATLRDAGNVDHQKALVEFQGADTEPVKVSAASPMPVEAYGELVDAIEAMRMAVQSMTRTIGLMQPDTAARMRVALDSITAGLTLATITTVSTVTTCSTVTTVSTLTNQSQLGGFAAQDQVPALMRAAADNLRRNISVT